MQLSESCGEVKAEGPLLRYGSWEQVECENNSARMDSVNSKYVESLGQDSSLLISSSAISEALEDLNENCFLDQWSPAFENFMKFYENSHQTEKFNSHEHHIQHTDDIHSEYLINTADNTLPGVTTNTSIDENHNNIQAQFPYDYMYGDYNYGTYGHILPNLDFNSKNLSNPVPFHGLSLPMNSNEYDFCAGEAIASTPTNSDFGSEAVGDGSFLDWSLQSPADHSTVTHEMTFKDLLQQDNPSESPQSSPTDSPNSSIVIESAEVDYTASSPTFVPTHMKNSYPELCNINIVKDRPYISHTSNSTVTDINTSKNLSAKEPVTQHKSTLNHPELSSQQEVSRKSSSSPTETKPRKSAGPVPTEQAEARVCRWVDCGAVFYHRAQLSRHIERAHVDQRRGDDFTCFWAACARKHRPFNARYKLLIHMRVHSGERPNRCTFPGCGKAFSRLENLKIHQRSHTGERPYVCGRRCGKAFSNSSDRAKHQRTHLTAKPYKCSVPRCNKSYTDPSSLRKHVKNHSAQDQLLARTKITCTPSEDCSSHMNGDTCSSSKDGSTNLSSKDGDVVRFSLRCHLLSRKPAGGDLGVAPLADLPQEDLDTWIN